MGLVIYVGLIKLTATSTLLFTEVKEVLWSIALDAFASLREGLIERALIGGIWDLLPRL